MPIMSLEDESIPQLPEHWPSPCPPGFPWLGHSNIYFKFIFVFSLIEAGLHIYLSLIPF